MMLRLASTDNKRGKIQNSQNLVKWHDCEERVTSFLTTQTACQIELWIKRYKRSKFRSNLVKSQKVKVTRGTNARVTRGTSVELSWNGMMWKVIQIDGRHVDKLGFDKC